MYLGHIPLVVKPMHVAHIPAVASIERESFPTPWPDTAYRHELTQNEMAHYYVLGPQSPHPMSADASTWHRLRQMAWFRPGADSDEVWGYAGFWMMVDEAHISTLAVRHDMRQRGLGQCLLLTLLDEARNLEAVRATLEVRISNCAAQALYAKYGFEEVGRREGYYPDNGEDALLLMTPDFSSVAFWDTVGASRSRLLERLGQASVPRMLPAN